MDPSNNIISPNENNYATWKIQMKVYLIKDSLFGIVHGFEVAPVGIEPFDL